MVAITPAAAATIGTVDCGATRHAIGGGVAQLGAFVVGDHMVASYPSDAAGVAVTGGTVNPRYWTMRMEAHASGWTVYAVCEPN